MLVLLKPFGDHKVAIVPQGPEHAPQEDEYGPFLEDFSQALATRLGPSVAFIRYDLPWASPYAAQLAREGQRALPEQRTARTAHEHEHPFLEPPQGTGGHDSCQFPRGGPHG